MDLVPAELRTQRQARAPDGWRIPPTPMSADTSPEDVAWGTPRRKPLPARTFEQKLKLHNGPLMLPRHYIYCTRITAGDRFRPFLERAQREGWGVRPDRFQPHPEYHVPGSVDGGAGSGSALEESREKRDF